MERASASTIVVCDAGPLIHLDELAGVGLLADMGHLMVPSAVWEEVRHHRPNVLTNQQICLERVETGTLSDLRLQTLIQVFSLDAGEREALILLGKHPTPVFLTDDASARIVATQLGYEVHGTIGVLVRAIRRGTRTNDEILDVLAEIPRRSTLYIRKKLLAAIIERVKAEGERLK